MRKILIILGVVLFALALGFLFWRFSGGLFTKNQTSSGPVNLTYWGLWEDENLIKPVIGEFEKQNPNIKVNYIRQSSVNYRPRVQTQISGGQGPDVLRIHNSWIPMFEGLLSPAPSNIFTEAEYKNTFYPIAGDFIKSGQILAAPVEIDGIALFVNEDILKAANVGVPTNWREFQEGALKMTVKDPSTGFVKTSGAALGLPSNVDHWPDILGMLLFQQPGVNFSSLASPAVAEVFSFFTSFAKRADASRTTWDQNMPSSTQAFAEGRLAFYFAPSWRAVEIRLANPSLRFKIVPVPQLHPETPASYGSFWVEAVSINSAHPNEAWQFIKFLTSAEAQKLLYSEASKVRPLGEPYSRVDLAKEIIGDPLGGAYVTQGPYYKSWYLSSNTLDQGINDQIIKYFEDGINATVGGADPQTVLPTVDAGVKQVLSNIKPPAPATTGKSR